MWVDPGVKSIRIEKDAKCRRIAAATTTTLVIIIERITTGQIIGRERGVDPRLELEIMLNGSIVITKIEVELGLGTGRRLFSALFN